MKFREFISELNRRNVIKSTIAYLAVAWVIIQIASIILPTFNAPDYALKILIYLLSVGLILWVGFSWIYDLTPEGFQKTKKDTINEEFNRQTNRRLNFIIAGALLLAVMLLISVSFWAGSQWNEGILKQTTRKIAVIPFKYETNKNETEDYFKTGMTDALINELSKVDQLTIINQASTELLTTNLSSASFVFTNVIEQVDYFIYGSINRLENTVEVFLELKEKIDSKPIWQKRYSRDISEVRLLWAEAASDLAMQMGIEVKLEDSVLWSNLKRVNPETYELYLKGKHYLNKSTEEDWQRGMVYLNEAKERNPSDPNAYAGLAEGYITLGHGPAPPPDVFPKALEAAKRAIQLDSTNAEGWAALAHYHTYFGWDWKLAEYAFKRANTLNPNMAYNHYHRAWYLAIFGRMNEAIEEHKRAQELDPFTPLHTAWLGELYRMVGEYEKGLIEVEKAAQMQDDYALSMFVKGKILMDQGKYDEGLEILKQASEIVGAWKYSGYAPALIKAGRKEEAKTIIQELEAKSPNGWRALCLAGLYSKLGDFDKALEWFNYKEKHAWFPGIRIFEYPEELQKDPRFLKLISDMNLPYPSPLVYDPDI